MKEGNFAVLRYALPENIPAILLESGFITNEKDRQYLTSQEPYVERALVKAINQYFEKK